MFEKSLIESYVEQNGVDPITKDALSISQLIEIAQTPQQYALTNAVNSSTLKSNYSIPNLLTSLQNEWDAVMLENFQLRQQLDTCKKELSTALYRYEAAMRVATRATMDADKLKQELTTLTKNIGIEQPSSEELDPLPEDILQSFIQRSAAVAKESRKKKIQALPPDTFTFEAEQNTYTMQEGEYNFSTRFTNGNSLTGKLTTLYSTNGQCYLLKDVKSLGSLHNVTLDAGKTTYALPLDGSNIIIGTDEGSLGIYDLESHQTRKLSSKVHDGPVVNIAWPNAVTEDFFISVGSDGSIVFTNLKETTSFSLIRPNFNTTFADVHKDGLIILLGSKEELFIYSISNSENDPITVPHNPNEAGEIVSAKFGLNGYWLLLATANSFKVHDLRKPALPFAVEPIVLENKIIKAFDVDPACKLLFLLTEGPDELVELHHYQYNKSDKTWILQWSKDTNVELKRNRIDNINYVQQNETTYLQVLSGNAILSVQLNN